ncbi:hypothetical protein Skr01_35800 [Sphaerisporangium krabiense]|uniref:GIY-YIG domain-containing protein n=1 Tax=Sphaerisporangium krabiense TaxID=763782 RepID=A0A7W9DQ25_9ACTN|nr:GIY-YIG nuclease family protein [Sphaerisporangium krabiense]MBB5626574.1 hypothetical protein [Sphaerisporangium krabiense]GII63495.1 hypothetical protein Skr01_35800 [Sphaerisporangium krabiense]
MPTARPDENDLQVPRATRLIREEIAKFLASEDPNNPSSKLGKAKAAIYAFYDYDGEPIYVGQTSEGVSSRIGRHLTGQRSDAVAKFVLDPFEVAEIQVWTIHGIIVPGMSTSEKRALLNRYESTVYQELRNQARFRAILNEAVPAEIPPVELPDSIRGRIIPDELWGDRRHSDVRIARRANHVARLSQLISERQPSSGLRRTLHLQTQRLEWLSNKRLEDLKIPRYHQEGEQTEIEDD